MNRILIIEDDPGSAEIVMRMCAQSGINPQEFKIVKTLAEGLPLGSSGEYDLIFLDLTLPPDSERDVIRDGIPPLSQDAPLVVFTGSTTVDIVMQCHAAGAQACLLKQKLLFEKCGVEKLTQAVSQAMLNWRREHARTR